MDLGDPVVDVDDLAFTKLKVEDDHTCTNLIVGAGFEIFRINDRFEWASLIAFEMPCHSSSRWPHRGTGIIAHTAEVGGIGDMMSRYFC